MQPQTKPVTRQIIKSNDSLPLLYVDGISTNKRQDGVYLIKFLASLPDGLIEQVRLMVHDKAVRMIIDNLCKNSGYYPDKDTKTQKKHDTTVT